MNDLFYCVKNSELHNFVDDNIIPAVEFSAEYVLETRKKKWNSYRLV